MTEQTTIPTHLVQKKAMMDAIMELMKANNCYISEDAWLQLAFMSDDGLKAMCKKLNIAVA